MRLFVGIAISDVVRERLRAYQENLQRAGAHEKWVKAESLHVTLKFIGETQKLLDIERELFTIKAKPIEMAFRQVGFFTPQRPRIFWAGVEAGPGLEALAGEIEEKLFRVGVPREPHTYQGYQPHITLARAGSGRPEGSPRERNKNTMKTLQDMVQKQPPPDFGTMTADEFILFRSETLPGGSRYTPLKRFPLK